MTREETIKILTVLKAAYPNYYGKLSRDEAMGVISLWNIQLGTIPGDIVLMAINKIIATNKWPPSISEIKDKINSMGSEARATVINGRCTKEQREHLLRIIDHCSRVPAEPSLLQMTGGGMERLEQAHDKQKSPVPSIPTRR